MYSVHTREYSSNQLYVNGIKKDLKQLRLPTRQRFLETTGFGVEITFPGKRHLLQRMNVRSEDVYVNLNEPQSEKTTFCQIAVSNL